MGNMSVLIESVDIGVSIIQMDQPLVFAAFEDRP